MADPELTKTRRTLYVVILILLVNLGGTGWLVWRTTSVPIAPTATVRELPQEMKANREHLMDAFVEGWNNGDVDAVYEMFDRMAQVQLPPAETKRSIQAYMTTFGTILDKAWSHHTYEGRREGKDWFDLYYKVRFGGGATPTGTVKLAFFFDGERYGVYGFDLSYE